MSHLHAQGWIHHDIKPDNILCSYEEGRYVFFLTDYSLATRHDESLEAGEHPSHAYTAPEVTHAHTCGCPEDVYSLGKTLLRLAPESAASTVLGVLALMSNDNLVLRPSAHHAADLLRNAARPQS